MKTKIYLITLVILMSTTFLSAQQFTCQTIIHGSDTGVVCTAIDPDKGMGKMVSNNDDAFALVDKSQSKSATIYAVAFTDPKNGWAIGTMESCSVNCGVIFHTTNGGEKWSLQYRSGTNLLLKSFKIHNSETARAIGTRTIGDQSFDTILVTHNGGSTWVEISNSSSQLNVEVVALNTDLTKD